MAASVDQKLLRQTKFPPEFNQKVDMQKVNIEVMKKWIGNKISEILGAEDDVVIELCFNLLEGSRYPNIKVLQIQLTGFLEADTAAFCKELWNLCLSAQANPQGVPKELLEAKKLELIQEKIEAEKAAEAARQRREQERARERDLDRVRQRERMERGDRNRGPRRGTRDGRDGDHRRPRQDFRDRRASPPVRRRSPDDRRSSNSRRVVDTYIPVSGSRNAERPRKRSSSSSSASITRSRSRTPPARRQRRSPSRSASPPPRPKGSTKNNKEDSDVDAAHTKSRARYSSSERSQSAASSSDVRHRRRSRSPSSRSSSPANRTKQSQPKRTTTSSPPPDPANMGTQAGDQNAQQKTGHTRDGEHSRGRSNSPSSKSRAKRRPSMDRYEPKAKRRRNTSSPEAE